MIHLRQPQVYVAVEHTPSASGLPTSAPFGVGNGGEFRKLPLFLSPALYTVCPSLGRADVPVCDHVTVLLHAQNIMTSRTFHRRT